jgi:hypothetical protein
VANARFGERGHLDHDCGGCRDLWSTRACGLLPVCGEGSQNGLYCPIPIKFILATVRYTWKYSFLRGMCLDQTPLPRGEELVPPGERERERSSYIRPSRSARGGLGLRPWPE